MKAGVVGRDDCTGAVGPQGRRNRNADAAAIASEPSRMHARTAQWTNKLQNAGYSHGDRPLWRSQMFITPVTSFQVNVRGT